MIVVHCQSDELGTPRQGHYFACGDCGWCSPVYHGEHSQLRAAASARRHCAVKAATRDEAR